MPSEEIYGLLTIGEMEVAIPLSSLREVLRRPDQLSSLPETSPALLGAMELRGAIIPVVDLTTGLGITRTSGDPKVVVIVSSEERLLALVVDAVRGVTRLDSSQLQGVASGEDGLVSDTFQQQDGAVTCVLNTSALMHLPGIPTVAAALNTVVEDETVVNKATRRLTLVQCDDYTLAFDVADIHTTVPGAMPLPSILTGDSCVGASRFRDQEIGVIDPLKMLGLGELDFKKSTTQVVLEFPTGFVAIGITKLLSIVDVDQETVYPIAGLAVANPTFLDGVVNVEDRGLCFVLDRDNIRKDTDIIALSTLNVAADHQEIPSLTGLTDEEILEDAAGKVAKGEAYISYSAGTTLATPLAQIEEIIPIPSDFTDTEVGGYVLGIMVHRDCAVPLLDLRTILGLATSDARNRCMLIVKTENSKVAFVVDRLHVVDNVSWRDPSEPLLQLGESTELIQDLDLKSVADHLLATV